MTLEEALARIAELEGEATGLKDEKTALLKKRDELLGKLTKLKRFEAYGDVDVEELIRIKTQFEQGGAESKSHYESLYQKDKTTFEQRLAQIEQERTQEKQARTQEQQQLVRERLKAAVLTEFSKSDYGVFSPEQLFRLVGDRCRFNDKGEVVSGDEYKEIGLSDFLKELKADQSYQNQFKPSGASGSGALPAIGAGGSGVNPWKRETFNLTQQGKIIRENPRLAESLKAAAGVRA